MTISSDITLKSSQVVYLWLTNTIQNITYSLGLVNSHI